MCGIFGFYLNRPLTDADIALGREGILALRHRGPDHWGVWSDQSRGVFLAHARLSIIDPTEARNQPMIRGQAVLAYNGEIYNYQELQAELARQGAGFSTRGDAEVFLQSWLHWGEGCVDHFDGMFAVAIYQDGTLHLAIDPFGEKPLYWARTADGIYFSSEPGPLVRLLHLKAAFLPSDTAAFLCLGFLPNPSTGYQDLYRMQPGTWMTYAPTAGTSLRKYWTPPAPVEGHGPVREPTESMLDDITAALSESLRVRLRADVPLGIFLSSGIDSALVAALCVRELNCRPLALTVRFPDNEVADESGPASRIAGHLGLEHRVVDSREDPARTSPAVIYDLFGEANDNLTIAAAYQMSLQAATMLRVALSGMGGDEMFYGYNKYHLMYAWRRALRLPAQLRRALSSALRVMPQRWTEPARLLSASDACRFIAAKNTAASAWLWKIPEVERWAHKYFADPAIPVTLAGRHFDLLYTLPDTYIPAMERGSMRASLEVRTPYLSRRLIETLARMDQRSLLAFGQKAVTRRILARYLPEKLFDFPKKGFNYPLAAFLRAGSHAQPRVPGLSQAMVDEVWQKRMLKGWQKIAVRMKILEHFLQRG